jgi:hypothetical protein
MDGSGHPPESWPRWRGAAFRLGLEAVGVSIGFGGILSHLFMPLPPGLARSIRVLFLHRLIRRRREADRVSLY